MWIRVSIEARHSLAKMEGSPLLAAAAPASSRRSAFAGNAFAALGSTILAISLSHGDSAPVAVEKLTLKGREQQVR